MYTVCKIPLATTFTLVLEGRIHYCRTDNLQLHYIILKVEQHEINKKSKNNT